MIYCSTIDAQDMIPLRLQPTGPVPDNVPRSQSTGHLRHNKRPPTFTYNRPVRRFLPSQPTRSEQACILESRDGLNSTIVLPHFQLQLNVRYD